MKTPLVYVGLLVALAFLCASGHAQEKDALGTQVEAYDLGDGVFARVTRSEGGRVSRIVIAHANLDDRAFDCSSEIDEKAVLRLVDRLVPESVRGAALPTNALEVGAGCAQTHGYQFENVAVTVTSTLGKDGSRRTQIVIEPKEQVWLPW